MIATMTAETWQRLDALLRKITGIRRPILDSTRLFHDLSLSGEDAVEFLNYVHQTFGTRFEGFEFDVYFPDELDGFLMHIAKHLFGYKARRYKDFRFGHLVQVVEAGAWFEPAP